MATCTSFNRTASFSHFGFLLLPNFTMLAFSTALEVLRMANQQSGQDLYRWSVLSHDTQMVVASNGLFMKAQVLNTADLPDVLLVCGGVGVEEQISPALCTYLQQCAAQGVALGSLCTGTSVLAHAGLLDGYICASHWEDLPRLRLAFPRIEFSDDLFVLDRDRLTCTGGVAPLDLMLNIVAQRLGSTVVASVADQFVVEYVRDHKDRQKVPLQVQVESMHPALAEVVALMQANIEEPLSLEELSQFSHLSQRQLQRIFREQFAVTPSHYYLSLRLYRARELLRQTGMSITEVMRACGFQSACHFSKSYRDEFAATPSSERRKLSPDLTPLMDFDPDSSYCVVPLKRSVRGEKAHIINA